MTTIPSSERPKKLLERESLKPCLQNVETKMTLRAKKNTIYHKTQIKKKKKFILFFFFDFYFLC
jgi:hypothetical protein